MTVPNHPLTLLMRRPNPYMSGDVVQQYIINAMHVSGDAYLMKQKNNAGELVALYPIMPEQVIPKGTVKTYKQVAIGIKSPKSARAVANACAQNPYAPFIPCHRVIRSDGKLGGYSGQGGIKTKLKMLKKEGILLK